jgi:hypothetical protein
VDVGFGRGAAFWCKSLHARSNAYAGILCHESNEDIGLMMMPGLSSMADEEFEAIINQVYDERELECKRICRRHTNMRRNPAQVQ